MLMPTLTFPIQEFRHIVQACRVDEPLGPGDDRFADLTDLRAGSSVVDELSGSLEQELEEGQFHRGIIAGHRGAGKSTELLQLKSWADMNGFLCLRVEVDTHLGNIEPEFSDLYLLAAETVVRGMAEIGSPLPSGKLQRIEEWFAEVTQQKLEQVKSEIKIEAEAKAGGEIPLLVKLFSRFNASIAASSSNQVHIKQVLRQTPDVLIDLTNDLIQSAIDQLTHTENRDLLRPRGVLLVFDNLDRYPAQTIENLLTRGATLMRLLACHALYTIPIELRCNARNVSSDEYEPDVILPMSALRSRHMVWKTTVDESEFIPQAIESFYQLLEKRIDVEKLFERPNDARLLVKMSGGCVRDLMKLVTASRQKSRKKNSPESGVQLQQISHLGVQGGIIMQRDNRAEGLKENDFKRLAAIAHRDPTAQHLDDEMLRLLGRRCALRYKDNEGQWYDVHPLLIETESFKRALASLESNRIL